jgi:hypothetical protein
VTDSTEPFKQSQLSPPIAIHTKANGRTVDDPTIGRVLVKNPVSRRRIHLGQFDPSAAAITLTVRCLTQTEAHIRRIETLIGFPPLF